MKHISTPSALTAVCAALLCAATALAGRDLVAINPAAFGQLLPPDRKVQMVERMVETFYVGDIDTTRMVDEAIRAMLRTLDPHSQYSDAEETRQLNEPLQGNFSGIGIQFQMLDDTLYVIQTIAGGPSERVGLMAGDRILAAGDSVLSGVKRRNVDVQKILRGPKGTRVDIDVLRDADTIPFSIVRDDIPIYSVDAAFMADDTTGYVKVSRFAETTADEFEQAMKRLEKQGMKRVLIDLQDNGGGYLQAAHALASMFLDRGDMVVYTDGDRVEPQTFVSGGGRYNRLPVTVLVNQFSASAAEIMAGAIQDNDRGTVVGRRTFGKGLVQRPFPFPDGSMVRLTVARYHTPSGRCIQKPYSDGDTEAYALDFTARLRSGELYHADSVRLDSTLLYHTLREHRPVYGGGGIMPDVFVPVDTSEYTTYYRDLTAKGLINRLAINTVDRRREEMLAQWPTAEAFIAGFETPQQMVDELVEMGAERGVEPDSTALDTSGALLRRLIKAFIARDLYDMEALYRIVTPHDPVVRRALAL